MITAIVQFDLPADDDRQKASEIFEISFDELADITTKNFFRLFTKATQ